MPWIDYFLQLVDSLYTRYCIHLLFPQLQQFILSLPLSINRGCHLGPCWPASLAGRPPHIVSDISKNLCCTNSSTDVFATQMRQDFYPQLIRKVINHATQLRPAPRAGCDPHGDACKQRTDLQTCARAIALAPLSGFELRLWSF